MDWTEIVGHTGSVLSSATFIPQVYKIWRTRSVGDLSLSMMLIVFASTIVWVIYGVGKGLLPVIICNSFICLLSVLMIYFKFRFTKQ